MPYSITTKDGITINNIPDDIPPDSQVLKDRVASIRAGGDGKPQPQFRQTKGGPSEISGATDAQGRTYYETPANERPAPTPQAPLSIREQMFGMGSPTASFVKGAVIDPAVGLNKLLADTGLFGTRVKEEARNLTRNYMESDVEARQRAGREGFDFFKLAGAVASPLNRLLSPAAQSTSLPGRVGVASSQGAVQAGLTPSDSSGVEKLAEMGGGAALGALFPVAGQIVSNAKKLGGEIINPLTAAGRDRVIRQKINELIPENLRPQFAKTLQDAQEIVPGSKPTVAEALADIPESTAVAARQARLSGVEEAGISAKFAARKAEQEAARAAALAVDETAVPMYEALRSANAANNYGTAFAQSVKVTPKLAVMMRDNPFLVTAAKTATEKAEAFTANRGQQPSLTQFLHWTKQSLDDRIQSADTDPSLKASLTETKKNLVNWVKTNNPEYEKARKEFAKASKPINEMQIGRYLSEKLRSPLDDKERAGAFALAIQQAPLTIKKASSGEAVATNLSDVVSPKQVAVINNVLADIKRTAAASSNAKLTRVGTGNLDESPGLPNLLSRTATIVNTILSAAKSNANEKLNAQMADLMLDPQKFAGFIQSVPPKHTKTIANILYPRLTPENQKALMEMTRIAGAYETAEQLATEE
jgi:hypothetical protein